MVAIIGVAMAREQPTVVRTADDNSISETVIYAVATARGVCPIELETPLYEALDTEALDRLLSSGSQRLNLDSARIEFTWAECTVVVHGTGRVAVTAPADEIGESELAVG